MTVLIADIQAAVESANRLPAGVLVGRRRVREIVFPRQEAMLLSRRLTAHSTTVIGKHFGGRDHTTVLWSLKRALARAACDPETASELERIGAALASDEFRASRCIGQWIASLAWSTLPKVTSQKRTP